MALRLGAGTVRFTGTTTVRLAPCGSVLLAVPKGLLFRVQVSIESEILAG
jgi:hypothetical protein